MTAVPPILRTALAELTGTALLLMAIIGSGIAAQRLSPGDPGLELLESAIATAATLAAIIVAIGTVSGAHLNPMITLASCLLSGMRSLAACAYVVAQCIGAVLGAILANLMFSLPAVDVSSKARLGPGLWLGEVVATFGLVLVVFGTVRSGQGRLAPLAVAGYIAGAYWFTSSTSFANPAVTLARTLSDTFAGISPASAPAFLVAELAGGLLGTVAVWVFHPIDRSAPSVAALAPDFQTDKQ